MKKNSVLGVGLAISMLTLAGCGCGTGTEVPVSSEASSVIESTQASDEVFTLESETGATMESSESESTASSVATTGAASQNGLVVPLWSDPNNGVLVDKHVFADVTQLPNKSIPYGNDWEDKDETGLANGIHYYESMYDKYNAIYRVKTDEKLIYLTMDEGYEAGFTPKILDTLKEKKVHAVFFLTKQFFDSDPDLIQRMIDEGHILGNHTCNHPSGGYPLYVDSHGFQSFVDDVSKLHKLVYDKFGYTMKLFRFPEGEASEQLMAELNNLGYSPVFWSYAHRDFVMEDQPEVSVTLERCLSHMAPGAVYLLHAVSSSNTEALGDFIDQARAKGYEFGDFSTANIHVQ